MQLLYAAVHFLLSQCASGPLGFVFRQGEAVPSCLQGGGGTQRRDQRRLGQCLQRALGRVA